MNNVVLSGRLTDKPVLRTTGSGNSMVTFCLAVRSSEEKTNFFDCVAYERLADLIYKHVAKGEKVTVMGNLNQRTYEGKDGKNHNVIEVFVREAEFQLKLTEVEVDEEPKTEKAPKGKKSKKSTKDGLPF